MKYTFKNIEDNKRLLYKYVRGSQAYGTNIATSDTDEGGVFVMSKEDVFGLSDNKVDQVNDERNDTSWYEVGKYIELLCKANPTMLESLFVPERCVLYMHPAFKVLYDNRQMFVTKETFNSFCGYAKSQIEKARGLNKKIVNPVNERKDVMDFCRCVHRQGSTKLKVFLNRNGLLQKYVGLVHVPDMDQVYGIYYDWRNHMKNEKMTAFEKAKLFATAVKFGANVKVEFSEAFGYRGVMDEVAEDTTQIRMSSVVKGARPINVMQFNEDGFKNHRRKWREYNEWVLKRNPQRYLENQDTEFDRKNMMHCARLLTMGIEIAKTGQVNVDRTNIDRDFLLNIRQGNSTYDELMEYMTSKLEELNEAIKVCTLPETVDHNKVNEILVEIRKQFN